ncbi:MAG: dihydroneopterin aldolase [Microthrixaceae bacterium]
MSGVGDPPRRADRIELRGLRVLARCGVLAEEHARPQPFEFDLDVETGLRDAGSTDDLGRTVDYGELCTSVATVATGEHVDLMETLAERVAAAVLRHDAVSSVTVSVRKLRPPVPEDLATAGVRIHRIRIDAASSDAPH